MCGVSPALHSCQAEYEEMMRDYGGDAEEGADVMESDIEYDELADEPSASQGAFSVRIMLSGNTFFV
jgi:hypothetical protein